MAPLVRTERAEGNAGFFGGADRVRFVWEKKEKLVTGVLQHVPFFPNDQLDFLASGPGFDLGKSPRRRGHTHDLPPIRGIGGADRVMFVWEKKKKLVMGVLQHVPFFPNEQFDFLASGPVFDLGKSRRHPNETPPRPPLARAPEGETRPGRQKSKFSSKTKSKTKTKNNKKKKKKN